METPRKQPSRVRRNVALSRALAVEQERAAQKVVDGLDQAAHALGALRAAQARDATGRRAPR